MRQIIATGAVICTLTLASCGGGADETPGEQADDRWKTIYPAYVPEAESLIERWPNMQNPDIRAKAIAACIGSDAFPCPDYRRIGELLGE